MFAYRFLAFTYLILHAKNRPMKTEQIKQLFEQFENACYLYKEIECWSARELQNIFEYSEWRNFLKVIDKAKTACGSAGSAITDHFVDINKMVEVGSEAKRNVEDFALTRYACYLIAQNADPLKSSVAFAQTYFAVQTRKQEIIENRLLDIARVSAREKLTKSEKKLSGIAFQRGVNEKDFAIIRSKGDESLFGGFTTGDMKKKLGVPESRALADFLPTLTIKAKDFATELTSHNIVDKDLKGESHISREHVDNNLAVRTMLQERGVKPEKLPAAEDLKKVERRLKKDEKNIPHTVGTKKELLGLAPNNTHEDDAAEY
jgi:DNA-damage-inducible protein D